MAQATLQPKPGWKKRLYQEALIENRENRAGLSGHRRGRTYFRLNFSPETRAMRTRFRDGILNYIFRTAVRLSNNKVRSSYVSVSSTEDEEDSLILDMTLIVDGDWDTITKLRHDVLVRVGDWSEEWTEEDKEDYGRRIYFGFLPSGL